MDPWTRFEEALHTLDDPAAELGRVLRDLDSTDMGTRAERQELRASATALLAERGEVPLDAAIRECAAAWALGCQGWPSLYLSWAALRRSQPQLAIESLSRIPPRYFDDQDLHWRTVQALACEAEARIAQGERAQAGELLSRLNWAASFTAQPSRPRRAMLMGYEGRGKTPNRIGPPAAVGGRLTPPSAERVRPARVGTAIPATARLTPAPDNKGWASKDATHSPSCYYVLLLTGSAALDAAARRPTV